MNRQQNISINDVKSNPQTINHRDSSPVLFLFVINDIVLTFEDVNKSILDAYGTAFAIKANDNKFLIRSTNLTIKLQECYNNNGLDINMKKSALIHFIPKNASSNKNFMIKENNSNLQQVTIFKILGVHFIIK